MSLSEIINLLGGDDTMLGRGAEDVQGAIDWANDGPVSRSIQQASDWARGKVDQFSPFDENSNLRWGVRALEHMTPGEAGGAMLDETVNNPVAQAASYVVPEGLMARIATPALQSVGADFGAMSGKNAIENAVRRMAVEKYGAKAEGLDMGRFTGRTPDVPVEAMEASKDSDGAVSATKFGQRDWQNLQDYIRAKRSGKMPGMNSFQLGPNDELPSDMVGGSFSKESKGTAARANERYQAAALPVGAGVMSSDKTSALAIGLSRQRAGLEKDFRRALVADDPQGQGLLAQWGMDPKAAGNPKNLPLIRDKMNEQIVRELRSSVPDPRAWKAVAPMIAVGMGDGPPGVSRETPKSGALTQTLPAEPSGTDFLKRAGINAGIAVGGAYLLPKLAKALGGRLFPNAGVAAAESAVAPKAAALSEAPGVPSAGDLFTTQPLRNPNDLAREFAETVPGKFMPPAVVNPGTGFTAGPGAAGGPPETAVATDAFRQMMARRQAQGAESNINRNILMRILQERAQAPAIR